MTRDDGFPIGDVDTSLYGDPKVKRLWRRLRPDSALMATAMSMYEQTRLASWRSGERVPAEDAAEDWLADIESPIEALRAVGLLDEDGRVPERAWDNWYGIAAERRQRQRDYWAAKKRRQREREEASDHLSTGDTTPPPLEPGAASTGDNGHVPATVPTVPSAPSDSSSLPFGVDWDSRWKEPLEAWERRGFRRPPTLRQRHLLFEEAGMVRDRPKMAAKWIREARGRLKTHEVIGYVLDRNTEWLTKRRSHAAAGEVRAEKEKAREARPVSAVLNAGDFSFPRFEEIVPPSDG